jgi:transcriptional regulator with XRE-family HTH domain
MTGERNRVFELRKARALTQEQLADLSGVDQATISRLEQDELPNPTFRTVSALAVVLGMSSDALMGDGADNRQAERRRGIARRQRPEQRTGLDRRTV